MEAQPRHASSAAESELTSSPHEHHERRAAQPLGCSRNLLAPLPPPPPQLRSRWSWFLDADSPFPVRTKRDPSAAGPFAFYASTHD